MDKNIIIDGVDVAGCRHYKNNGKCRIPHYQQSIKYVSCNCNEWDCDYKQLKRLEQLKNKYYQQTLDDEITISDLIEEIQTLKSDRTLERISKLSMENARLEQENNTLQAQLNNVTVQSNNAITALEQENRELGRKAFLAEQNVQTIAATFCEKDNKIKELEQERDELKKKLGTKEVQLANAEFDLHFEEMKTRELKQENKELKEQIESQKGLITVGGKQQYEMTMAYDKCKSALEEISGLASPRCTQCSQILNIVNEVLQ